jgi:hypothetical protein
MACRMAKALVRTPTAQGISLALKTHFLPSTLTLFISSFSYEGAFENGEEHGYGTETYANVFLLRYVGAFENGLPHGQGARTYADGSRYFSRLEDSFPPIYSYAFNFFFQLRGSFRKWRRAWPRNRYVRRRLKVFLSP